MTSEEITQYLTELNDELRLMDIKGEVSLYGGAVMVLAFKARIATKDVDAIFHPASEIRAAAIRIAHRHGLTESWLNDGVKGYVVEHSRRILFNMPNLTVFIPEPDYLLAMKALAARADTEDESDVLELIRTLDIRSAEDVLSIVEKYYPKGQIPPKTQYFIQGLFDL
jgi:hypothetical protein